MRERDDKSTAYDESVTSRLASGPDAWGATSRYWLLLAVFVGMQWLTVVPSKRRVESMANRLSVRQSNRQSRTNLTNGHNIDWPLVDDSSRNHEIMTQAQCGARREASSPELGVELQRVPMIEARNRAGGQRVHFKS